MKVKTYLPIFSGFYNTQWEFQYESIEEFIKEERENKGLFSEIDFNDVEIDNETYENDIVKSFCEKLPNLMSDYINSIEFEKIISPKEYNFENDSANVIIDVNIDKIKDFIYNNKDKFSEFLKKRYTSCDGFIPWYSNNFETWENDTKNFTDFSINGHYLGSILDFIAHMLGIDNYSIFENVYENLDYLNYVENLNEVINKSDNSLYEFFTKNKYTKETSLYYATTYENGNINQLCLNEKTLSIIKEYEENLKTMEVL